MTDPDHFALGCIILGTLLIAKTLGGSFIARLPLSAAMLYLGAGIAIGPWGWGLLNLDSAAAFECSHAVFAGGHCHWSDGPGFVVAQCF